MSRNMLTADQAAALTGYSASWIAKCCRRELIPHELVRLGDAGKVVYQIESDDLTAWATGPTAPRRYRKWSEADGEALRELYTSGTCTLAQIGAYLGRPVSQIKPKIDELGIRRDKAESYRQRNKAVDRLPADAVLIAKTCTRCGDMRDARFYPRNRRGYWSAWCYVCHQGRRRDLGKAEPTVRARDAAQELTRDRATNDGRRYTDDELDVLRDLTRTDLDVALTIGRSLYAVRNKRLAIGAVTERRGPRKPRGRSYWRIDLAVEAARLREHHRRLAEPEQVAS